MLLHIKNILLTTVVCSLCIVFVTGNGSPVLIKTGKKGKDKMILISGGKCGSPTLIKGSKKSGSEMILVGGQQDCDKPKVQIMKQFVPVPYYIPRPVYKYILRHHYVPVRQVVVKPVPVPYPVKHYGGNEHSYGGYGGDVNTQKSYGQGQSYGQGSNAYGDYGNTDTYGGVGNGHSESNYGGYGGYSKENANSYGENSQEYGNYAAGTKTAKYTTTKAASTSGSDNTDDAYYGGVFGNKDYNGVYKPMYDSADGMSSTSMQIESFLKQNSPQMSEYSPSIPTEDGSFSNYMNYGHYAGDDYDSKGMFNSKNSVSMEKSSTVQPHPYLKSATSSTSSSSSSQLTPLSSSSTSSLKSVADQSQRNGGNSNPTSASTQVSTYLSGNFGMPQQLKTSESNTQTSWKRLEKKVGRFQ